MDIQPYIPPPNYNRTPISPEDEKRASRVFAMILLFMGVVALILSSPLIAFVLIGSAILIRIFA